MTDVVSSVNAPEEKKKKKNNLRKKRETWDLLQPAWSEAASGAEMKANQTYYKMN